MTKIIIVIVIIALIIACFSVIVTIEERKDAKIEKQIADISRKGDKK